MAKGTTLIGGSYAFTGNAVPLVFEAGAVVALDATTWYDLLYARYGVVPAVPTLASVLESANARWYDTRSL